MTTVLTLDCVGRNIIESTFESFLMRYRFGNAPFTLESGVTWVSEFDLVARNKETGHITHLIDPKDVGNIELKPSLELFRARPDYYIKQLKSFNNPEVTFFYWFTIDFSNEYLFDQRDEFFANSFCLGMNCNGEIVDLFNSTGSYPSGKYEITSLKITIKTKK